MRNGYWTQALEREIFEDDIKNNIDELKAELLRHEKKQHAVNAKLLAALQPERKKKKKKSKTVKKNDSKKKTSIDPKLDKIAKMLLAIKKKIYHDSNATYPNTQADGSFELPMSAESDGKVQWPFYWSIFNLS